MFLSQADDSVETLKFPTKPRQVYFLNEEMGWILDDKGGIWNTRDGKNWQQTAMIEGIDSPATQLIFISEELGWVRTFFSLFMTSDGGKTWQCIYPTKATNWQTVKVQPLFFYPVNERVGWLAMSEGTILKTVDMGKTWEIIRLPFKMDVTAINAFDEFEGIIGGSHGIFHVNSGSGASTLNLPLSRTGDFAFNAFSFTTAQEGWSCGSKAATLDPHTPAAGILFRTGDGGSNWSQILTVPTARFFKFVRFETPKEGWLVSPNSVFQTSDGGYSWRKILELPENKRENNRD